jgi:hypothetical protein
MPQQFLHRPDIITMREQMRGNAVPNGVAADAFGQPRRTTGQTNGQLPSTLTGVMPADGPGSGVSRSLVCEKHVWPHPESAGTRIFPFQRTRSIDRAIPFGQILRMEVFDPR